MCTVAFGVAVTPMQLLARHQPVLVLHPNERFRPVAVEGFLADARLDRRTPDGAWAQAVETELPQSNPPDCAAAPCWRLDHVPCTPTDGIASIDCYAEREATRAPPSVVYGAVLRRGDRIALEYWYWYSYNFWSGDQPPSDRAWQAHEGDWEVVVVLLTRAGTPLLAGYSEHSCGKRRTWARVPKSGGTHPVVHVGLGSHANTFRPRTHPLDLRRQCYDQAGAALLRQVLTQVLERTGNGRRLGPGRTRLVRVTASSPAWMRFPGVWSGGHSFHVGRSTFPAGPTPLGPAFHRVWTDPVGTVLRWPKG